MIKVGLTGNMGSGKTVVASVFSAMGVPVFNADEESKKFLKRPDVIEKVAALFGGEVIAQGTINNKRLAFFVFSNPEALNRLNRILHPLVMEAFGRWQESKKNAHYVIMEAAILYESGYAKEFDSIIHVSCTEEISIERVINRDRIPRELVLERMRLQLKNDDKARISDFVIINDGTVLVIPQVVMIHKKLLERGA